MTIVVCGIAENSVVFVADGKRTGREDSEKTDAIKIYELASDIPIMITISGKAEMMGMSWLDMMPEFRSKMKNDFPDGPKLEDVVAEFYEFAKLKTVEHGQHFNNFSPPNQMQSLQDGNTFIIAGYDESSLNFIVWRFDRRPFTADLGSQFIVNCCCWIGNDNYLNSINYGSKYQTGMPQSDTVTYCRTGVDETITNNSDNSDVGGKIRTAIITKTNFKWIGTTTPETVPWDLL